MHQAACVVVGTTKKHAEQYDYDRHCTDTSAERSPVGPHNHISIQAQLVENMIAECRQLVTKDPCVAED